MLCSKSELLIQFQQWKLSHNTLQSESITSMLCLEKMVARPALLWTSWCFPASLVISLSSVLTLFLSNIIFLLCTLFVLSNVLVYINQWSAFGVFFLVTGVGWLWWLLVFQLVATNCSWNLVVLFDMATLQKVQSKWGLIKIPQVLSVPEIILDSCYGQKRQVMS